MSFHCICYKYTSDYIIGSSENIWCPLYLASLESLYLLKKEIKKSDRIKSIRVCWQIVAIILKNVSIYKNKTKLQFVRQSLWPPNIYLPLSLTCEVSDIANRSSSIKSAHDNCEKSWWCGPFSGWKPERFSSALFEGILACVHTKGAESYLHFFSYSWFSDQTSIAETQRSLSPSMKINVCSSRKCNSGADFETVTWEFLDADTAALEARAREEAHLVLNCFTSDSSEEWRIWHH